MIILDTQSLIWFVGDPKKLSKKARLEIDKAVDTSKVLVSAISIWEICLLVKKKRLEITMEVENWIKKVETLPFLQFVPIDNEIAIRSVFLPGLFHSDPADRIIIATAIKKGAPIITSDRRILRYPHVKAVW